MKRCILSAIAGALVMLLAIGAAARIHLNEELETKGYEHIDYVSNITPEECYVCGDVSGFQGSLYWGQDNVGIVNLNTFELLHLNINRYDEQGNRIEESAGYMSSSSLSGKETRVHAYSHPDNAYAVVKLTGVKYMIDRDAVQNHLCQTCLDAINCRWFTTQPPAEFAVISYEKRTIQPLLNNCPWFAAGNFGVDCEFKDDGRIDLLIHYIADRYRDK